MRTFVALQQALLSAFWGPGPRARALGLGPPGPGPWARALGRVRKRFFFRERPRSWARGLLGVAPPPAFQAGCWGCRNQVMRRTGAVPSLLLYLVDSCRA